ncbi:MAG: PHP domain-containing protein [Lachnospiraceae bacterium]|nr:PHP domain-containing protein [Lachnospiraceae bacterium]
MSRVIHPRKIDLHMHTTVSDGTDTPQEILAHVKQAGLEMFAISDHDATKGCEEILSLLTEEDPVFVCGVEFSCRDALGKYHILGYGYDPKGQSIQDVVNLGHGYRMYKARQRIDFLRDAFHFAFSEADEDAIYALDNPGKPHIANMMVKYGYVPSKEVAIRDYLNKLHTKNLYVKPEEAIAGILGAGGIPVLAHPCYGSGDQLIVGDEMDARLKRLIGFGLQGVEAFYSGFTPKLTSEMLAFAKKYDLYITAGSDYHGKNKMISIGDNSLADQKDLPEGFLRFLRDVKRTCGSATLELSDF